MNEAFPVAPDGLLTTADLAARHDFTLGLAVVSPSTRTIAGPGGTADVEPRVMQVLVILAEATGHVVTRDTLFRRCWGGVYVGDDSLNRAIAGVRKLATYTAGGSFEIETIPRTGYRLTGAEPEPIGGGLDKAGSPAHGWSRRRVAGGAVGLLTLGGLGFWSAFGTRSVPRFDQLMVDSEKEVRNLSAFNGDRTYRRLREAVSLRPANARAWGLLALVQSVRTQFRSPNASRQAIEEAEDAVRRALAIDSSEPSARLALFELQGSTLNWITRDRTLRGIIAADPTNVLAISELVGLLQSTGLNRESWNWNERALVIEPLSKDLLDRRALKLWIAGRATDADKVIDQVRTLYPSDSVTWWVQLLILALSARPRAAQAMLDNEPEMLGSPPLAALWRVSLPALDQRSPATIAAARQACIDAAERAGELAAHAVMILSALGEVNAAFDVVNGFLLWRGSIVRRGKAAKQTWNDTGWRIGVQWLFTPPCAVMRADARFRPLCDGIGISAYWRQRGVRPDYQLNRT